MDNKAGRDQHHHTQAPATPEGKNWLLVIAIDDYKHCAPLNNCVKDAKAIVQILQQRYRFDAKHTVQIFNENATRKNILKAFRDLQDKIQPADNLIVYFSGHGDNVHQIGYWIPIKAQPGEEDEYINAIEITGRLDAINCFHTFLIVDACFSGSLFQTKNAAVPKRSDEIYRSRWGLTASHSRELALDGKAGDNSPFAECLLLKLRQSNEALSAQDLATFIKNEVRARTREQQTPIFQPLLVRGHELGQFVFHLQQDEDADWAAALAENTIAAFANYRYKHQNGKYYQEAKLKIKALEDADESAWQNAVKINRISAFEDYKDAFPNGFHVIEANQGIERLLSVAPNIIIPKEPKLETPRLHFEPEMVFVQGGTFQMGSNERDDEKPIHEVTLKDFYIGKYPVTFEEYDAFCEATKVEKPNDRGWGRGKRPVINVNWEDVVAYAKWLSEQTGKNYRLPSEAEWEYAARGGNQSKGFQYAGSDNLDEVGWHNKNSNKKTHPVGGKKANELGIHDMSGNVWEWCADVWHDNYDGAPKDGSAWMSGGAQYQRVDRGGSWFGYGYHCRVAFRIRSSTGDRHLDLGFRLAGY